MSVDLTVYLPRSAMPSPARWAQAIRDAGFPVELGADFDVDVFTGYLPCQFRGKPAGFEYYSALVSRDECARLGLPAVCDFAVTLVTHADLREFATSLIAGSVLCQKSGGQLHEPQAGESYGPGDVLDWARQTLAEIETELQ